MNWKHFILVAAAKFAALFFTIAKRIKPEAFFWLRAEDPVYLLWLLKHKRRFKAAALPSQTAPVFSLLTPAYNTNPQWLAELIMSVRRQTFGDWELILIDDASTNPASQSALEALSSSDSRIRLLRNSNNLGISASTNRAAEQAAGDWLVMLDHDDLLYPDALATLYAGLSRYQQAAVLYADEDRLSPRGLRYRHHFKPAFSPSLLEMCNYILHPLCVRRSAWQTIGGMRSDYDGSQDYDLLLRLWDSGAEIKHIPGILYTWRESRESMAGNAYKPHIFAAGKRALRDHLRRRNESFRDIDDNPETELGDYRIHWRIPAITRVLLISDSLPSWRPRWQLEHCTAGPEPWRDMQKAATEDYDAVVILHHGVKCADQSSIEELIGWCLRSGVGVVAGRILDKDGCIMHAGLSLAPSGMLRADFYTKPVANCPPARRLRDCLAVVGVLAIAGNKLTALITSSDHCFADSWPLALCLAARDNGWRVVYTPFASFHASRLKFSSFAPKANHELLRSHNIYQDPFTNPYLVSTSRNDFRLPL